MLAMQIPKLQAREQLARMDAAVYGSRIHAAQKDQMHFDMMRGRVIAAAKE